MDGEIIVRENEHENEHEESLPEEILRSEVNLLLFPFFVLSNQEVGRRSEIEYKAVIKRGDATLEIYWNVIPSKKFGQPGPFDKEVFRALEQMMNELPYPIKNPVTFTTYEICQGIGAIVGGRQYEAIKQSLKRIASTIVHAKGTFYRKKYQRWDEGVFNLFNIYFQGSKLPNGNIAEKNYLFFDDLYLESLNARYVRPLDYKYYQSLSRPLSKRLYELLGVKFYGLLSKNISHVRYHYKTLCQLLPLKTKQYPSQARQKLDPAHKELIATAFLKQADWEDCLIYYYPGSRAIDEIERFSAEKVSEAIQEPAFVEDEIQLEWQSKTVEEKVEWALERWLVMERALRGEPSPEEIEQKKEELQKYYEGDNK